MLLRRNRSESASPRRRRRRIRKLRLLTLVGVLGVLAVTAFSYGVIVAVGGQLRGLDPFRQKQEQVDGYVYAGDGHTILAVLRGSQSRVLVHSADISPLMKQAIVATEDKRFYEHRGVDIRGMARALWADIRHKGAVQGGSTITQQFVKNALTGNARSVTRKLKEATLAWQLEQKWSKDQILTAYLNTIYFGNGAYGVERAARTYFGHRANKLTLPEAALLAGIPEDPSLYDPVAHPEAAKGRRTTVLRLMLAQKIIEPAQFRRAVRAPMPKPQNVHLSGVQGLAPYFGEYVKQQLITRFGAKKVFGSGFRVDTTINFQLQSLARAAIHKWLPSSTGPQAALVALNPTTGDVLAMYGGNSFHASQFNLATQGERQPGSAFKPFVLAAALKEGISPLTTFTSKPISIFLGNKYWYVHNFEGEYLGPIDLTKAISVSDNSVFSQLTKVVGPAEVVQTAKQMGITSPLQSYFGIGLGVEAVNPLEMARAYATFANGGFRVDGSVFGNAPRAITTIANQQQRRHLREQARGEAGSFAGRGRAADAAAPGRRHLGHGHGGGSPRSAGRRQDRARPRTTAMPGSSATRPQLVTAVWVGYPNKLVPMRTEFHGAPVVGGTYPALIWKSFMESALAAMTCTAEDVHAAAAALGGLDERVTYRDGEIQLDNGNCRDDVAHRLLQRATGPADVQLQGERGRGPERRRLEARQCARCGSRRSR